MNKDLNYDKLIKETLSYIHETLNGQFAVLEANNYKIYDQQRGISASEDGYLGNCICISGILQAVTVLQQYNFSFSLDDNDRLFLQDQIKVISNEMKTAFKEHNPSLLNSLPWFDMESISTDAGTYFMESISWGMSVLTLTRFIDTNYRKILNISKDISKTVTDTILTGLLWIENYQLQSGAWGWTKSATPDLYYTFSMLSTIDDVAEYFLDESKLLGISEKDVGLLNLFKKKTKRDLSEFLQELRHKAQMYIRSESNIIDKEIPIDKTDRELTIDLCLRLYFIISAYYSAADTGFSPEETQRNREKYSNCLDELVKVIIKLPESPDHKEMWNDESDFPLSLTEIPDAEWKVGKNRRINFSNKLLDPSIIALLLNALSYLEQLLERKIIGDKERSTILHILMDDSKETDKGRYWTYVDADEYNFWYTSSAIESLISLVDMYSKLKEQEEGDQPGQVIDWKTFNFGDNDLPSIFHNEKIRNYFFKRIFDDISNIFSKSLPSVSLKKESSVESTSNLFVTQAQVIPLFDNLGVAAKKLADGDKLDDEETSQCLSYLSELILTLAGDKFDQILKTALLSCYQGRTDVNAKKYAEKAEEISGEWKEALLDFITRMEANPKIRFIDVVNSLISLTIEETQE